LNGVDICGEARAPARKNLLQLADRNGIAKQVAVQTIERIATTAGHFTDFIGDLPIRAETLKVIKKAAKSNCARLI
jgi:serine/threonine-protein kinase HipA